MTPIHVVMRACALALVALFTLTPALAQDQLKVAIGQINNWENQPPTLGQDAGIFKRHNLVLDNVGTQGAGETMQPVIAGSADRAWTLTAVYSAARPDAAFVLALISCAAGFG